MLINEMTRHTKYDLEKKIKSLFITGSRRGSIIDIWVRGEDNQKYKLSITDFRPYFYVPNLYGEFTSLFGEYCSKIYVNDPSDVPIERAKYHRTWEADIPYVRRFLIDQKIRNGICFSSHSINDTEIKRDDIIPCNVSISPLILYLDIEILPDEGKFPFPESAEFPIISLTLKYSSGETYFTIIVDPNSNSTYHEHNWNVIKRKTEKSLLTTFIDLFTNLPPDIITGWNVDRFDLPYIQQRLINLELKQLDLHGTLIFDLLTGYKKIYSQRRYGLKPVAKAEGLTDTIESFKDTIKLYPSDIIEFARYNKKDVQHVVELDKKHSLLNFYLELKHLAGLETIKDTLFSSVLIDTLLLRISNDRPLPTKPEQQLYGGYEGAFVYTTDKGLFKGVAIYDFSSYYPSIINSFNLSPENIEWMSGEIEQSTPSSSFVKIKNGDDTILVKKQQGIMQKLLSEMIDQKQKITKQQKSSVPGSSQYKSFHSRREAIKGIINSSYGIMGYAGFRLYNHQIASTITKLGRDGIKKLISIVEEKYGFKVLVADTDSVFVKIPLDKAKEFTKIFEDEIKNYFSSIYKTDINFNLELKKWGDLLLTGVKKRYVMRCLWEDKETDYIDTKGYENIRMDQSKFTQNLLDELFYLILHDATRDEIIKFIQQQLSNFEKCSFDDIAISKGINKPLNSYKVNTPHIRGSIYTNTYLNGNLKYGDKVFMLWISGFSRKSLLDKDIYPPTNVICYNEDIKLPENIIIDWDKMKDVSIIKKVTPILNAIGFVLQSSTNTQMTL